MPVAAGRAAADDEVGEGGAAALPADGGGVVVAEVGVGAGEAVEEAGQGPARHAPALRVRPLARHHPGQVLLSPSPILPRLTPKRPYLLEKGSVGVRCEAGVDGAAGVGLGEVVEGLPAGEEGGGRQPARPIPWRRLEGCQNLPTDEGGLRLTDNDGIHGGWWRRTWRSVNLPLQPAGGPFLGHPTLEPRLHCGRGEG